jgi:Protein tyrosine and serine/threonine kinase
MVAAIIDRVRTLESPPYRPEFNNMKIGLHPTIETIMQRCWAEQPNDRPTFDEISKFIRTINRGK